MNLSYEILILSSFTVIASIIFLFLSNTIKSFPKDEITEEHKYHTGKIPRIGGFVIFIIFIFAIYFLQLDKISYLLIISSIPILFISLLEDLNIKTSPSIRIIIAFLSAFIFIHLFNFKIERTDIFFIDRYIINLSVVSLIFTLLVIVALVNSFNIIDGLNGLMPGYSIFVLFFIYLVASEYNQQNISNLILCFLAIIIPLFFFNFPKSYLFFGDFGAYFLGFIISSLIIICINTIDINSLYYLCICAYPFTEVVFSFFRKLIFEKKSPLRPDKKHFHMLVFYYFKTKNYSFDNSLASLTILIPNLIFLFIIFQIKEIENLLIIFLFFYMILYLLIYKLLLNYSFR